MFNRFLITNMKYPNIEPTNDFLIEAEMNELREKITEEDQEQWNANQQEIRQKITEIAELNEGEEYPEEYIKDFTIPNNAFGKSIGPNRKGIVKSVAASVFFCVQFPPHKKNQGG